MWKYTVSKQATSKQANARKCTVKRQERVVWQAKGTANDVDEPATTTTNLDSPHVGKVQPSPHVGKMQCHGAGKAQAQAQAQAGEGAQGKGRQKPPKSRKAEKRSGKVPR